MIPQENYKRWSAEVTLDTGDTSKSLLAAPGANKQIVVTFLVASVVVSAAQAVDIAIGTVNVMRIGASPGVAAQQFMGPMVEGIKGIANTALVITPAAAGPKIHVIAEGYYLPS